MKQKSLLYSRVRNDRNQLSNNSNSGGTGTNANSASSNIGAAAAENPPGSGRCNSSGNNAGGSSSNAGPERDSFSRWRDRQYYGPRRWFHGARDDAQWEKDSGELFKMIYV